MVGEIEIVCCLFLEMLRLVLLVLKVAKSTNYNWHKYEENYNEGVGCDVI